MVLTNDTLKEYVAQHFAHAFAAYEESYGMLTIVIKAEHIFSFIKHLKESADLQFGFLTDITAVHYPDRANEELCVVYHLHNLVANVRIRIKAYLPISRPDIASIEPLFSGANWMERETYDFFGVNFIGHPNLTRILNVEEMEIFPMRKEYPMEDPTRRDKDDEMFGRG